MAKNDSANDEFLNKKWMQLDSIIADYRRVFDGKSAQDARDLLTIRQAQYARFRDNALISSQKYHLIIGYLLSAYAGVTGMFGLNAIAEGVTAGSTLIFGSLGVALMSGALYCENKKRRLWDEDFSRNLDKLALCMVAEQMEAQEMVAAMTRKTEGTNTQTTADAKHKQRDYLAALEGGVLGTEFGDFEQMCIAVAEATKEAEEECEALAADANTQSDAQNQTVREQVSLDAMREAAAQSASQGVGDRCDGSPETGDSDCSSDAGENAARCIDCCRGKINIIREQDILVEGVTRPDTYVVTARARKEMEEFLFGEKSGESMQR